MTPALLKKYLKMKRLLLPLLAAIALPSFAGDLDIADFENLVKGYNNFSEKTDRVQSFDFVRCGLTLSSRECEVKFEDDKLKVNNSIGITSSQIKHVSIYSDKFVNFYMTIFYKDSNGINTFANFFVKSQKKFTIFLREFLYFVNQENESIPINYF